MMPNIKFLVVYTILCLFLLPDLKSQSLQIELKEVILEYNNHVGNEWVKEAYVEYAGKRYDLMEDRSVKITPLSGYNSLTIRVKTTEEDTYPDSTTESKTYSIEQLLSNKPAKIELFTLVQENRGRYSGYTAKWRYEIWVR